MKIVVVGLGVIGGSFTMALKKLVIMKYMELIQIKNLWKKQKDKVLLKMGLFLNYSNKSENLDSVENLAYKLGFKRVTRITPEYHDEMIGYIS